MAEAVEAAGATDGDAEEVAGVWTADAAVSSAPDSGCRGDGCCVDLVAQAAGAELTDGVTIGFAYWTVCCESGLAY